MAVISITDASKIEFYRGGKAGASVVVGYEDIYRRVARYEFTVPAPGASSITAQVNGPYFVESSGRDQPIRFYIGTSPTSHVNAGPDAEYTGVVTVSGRVISLAADIALVPGQTYYLWFFPSTDYFGWYYWSLNCTITTFGGVNSNPTTSAASVEMGKPVTIYTNRAGNLTHKLEYKFGNATGVIDQNVGDSCVWTPSIELARQIPENTEGTAVITCTTYLDGAPIGQPQQTTVTLTVPKSIVPTASATWTDTSGAMDAVGVLAQHVSKLTVKVSGTGSYGSSVNYAAATLDGKAYIGGVITGKGNLKLVVTVRDGRGRTGSWEETIYVAEYAVPVLKLSASRCQADGTADDFGEYAKITVTGSVTAIGNGNTATLTVDYNGTPETYSVAPSGFKWSKIVPVPSTTTRLSTATLADKLKSTTRDMVLSVGYATTDYLDGGRGIAFGETATEEGFTCAMPARFTGGVTGITAAMVGAAPTGYGLGGFAVPVPGNNLDTLKANGWYYCADSTAGGPSGYPLGNAVVEVSAGWAYSPVHQTLHFGTAGRQPFTIKRYWNNATNAWVDWEWINPPMLAGGEYRTTERYKGKAVYTKLINFGYLPNATRGTIQTGVDATLVFRCEGVTSNGYTLPYNYNGTIIELCADLGWILITTNKDYSSKTADIQIWYTKD